MRPLLAGAPEGDDEVLGPRDLHSLETVDRRTEGLVAFALEREGDVVMWNGAFCVAPSEPKEPVGGHPFGPHVGRMLQPEQWSLVVTMPERPSGDLLEYDGIGVPARPCREMALPGEEDAAVGRHHRAMLRNHGLPGF